ncbi:MAG: dihydropteroate synthase, partial [Lachnospiraceae bacterium]|nr:dihydropteroate synthase [Lachnospiraceae bacterium]
AGTNILFAPTFTANRIKLEEYGLENKLEEMNRELVELSRRAAGGKAWVAGDLTMCGKQLYPMGEMQFEELVRIYKEQICAIEKAGVDLYVVETMMSLQESRAALLALKETTEKPVLVSMTYNEDGRTLYGTDPVTAMVVLQSLGADAVGLNCSTGPSSMVPLIKEMAKVAQVPILAKPNAGMPELEDGVTVYKMGPEEFAETAKSLVEAGASILGGCCGTTPAHIRALVNAVGTIEISKSVAEKKCVLTSERKTVEIDLDGSFFVVGERINPTGKKKLQAELREGNLDLVRTMAREQEENGAAVLDINMGMNGIDEKAMMLEAVQEVASIVDCPLCIDSSHVDIIEEALRIYPGRALINSISLENEKFEKLIPIAKKYGAMFILLPLSDAGLPKDAEEKHQIIHTILEAGLDAGLKKEDIVVDGLVATVGANSNAAMECFETISYCKNELGLATICGLSNISFGLPERIYVNTAFLTMAIAKGLTMAIANPSQELLMNAAFASDMLLNKKNGDLRYIQQVNHMQMQKTEMPKARAEKQGEKRSQVFETVLQGNKGNILKEVDALLTEDIEPSAIIDEHLIPAINEVGILFDKKVYFLPQLISSAQTMEQAIAYLEPMLERGRDKEQKATIVMATVEGDIHDIGKNLVVLMLKNYGYRVIDLGKDVTAERILEAAIREKAQIIGLSALMTTTMMRMKDVVEVAKEKGYPGKIMIGGAAITPGFADEIGADGYSSDAADCVRLVERLLEG